MSEGHVARTWRARGLSARRDEWIDRFVIEAAKRSIPVHCEAVASFGEDVKIVHSQYGELLDDRSWAVLGRLGELAIPQESRGRIRWLGPEGEPAWWRVKDAP